ncbi:MAG: hypothetical protein R2794_09410 [Chitinophagales bacterium]
MIPDLRTFYNDHFTEEKYQIFCAERSARFQKKIEFKICETPVFIPESFRDKLFLAGEQIIDKICAPDFLHKTQHAIPMHVNVPGAEGKPAFIALDFGICKGPEGEPEPQLIEMQGFASLYAWQHDLGMSYKKHFNISDGVHHILNGKSNEAYVAQLTETLLGGYAPEHVILLEIEPEKQKTWIDFWLTRAWTGIEPVCITKIIPEGDKIFYMRNGVKTRIHRIYNRLIFDELLERKDLQYAWNLTDPTDVEWVCHPNWFFRISKYTLPLIQSPFVPETHFVHTLTSIPTDLENWVLKPLFSFAGHGVIFHVTEQDIAKAQAHGDAFILQRKVEYIPVIETPDIPAKCEIRLMYLWDQKEERPQLVINLARLSKGVMIGVDYNKNKSWVGGTVGYFK